MTQKFDQELGSVNISETVIATVCGVAAMECYGLVGMAPRNVSEGLSELLRMEAFERGVDVKSHEDGISVRIYIVVQDGVTISEVARNVQERVKYAIEKHLGLKAYSIDVRVQSVRVTDDRKRK